MSDAIIGFGTQVLVGDGGTSELFTPIPEIIGDVDGPSTTMNVIEVTPHKTTDFYREYKPGLIDPGEISFKMNYVKDDPTQASLKDDFDARTERNMRLEFPDGYTVGFTGFVTDFSQVEPLEAAITYSIKIKISGQIVPVGTA